MTSLPTTQSDRYDFARLDPDTQDKLRAKVAILLTDGPRTNSAAWKMVLAGYRLSHPTPHQLSRTYGGSGAYNEVNCTCGWSWLTNSSRGATHAARSHRRAEGKRRATDKALLDSYLTTCIQCSPTHTPTPTGV